MSKQVNFVAVTYEDLDVALDFSKKYNFEWDSMIGAEELVKKIGIPAYPAFVLLDDNGTPINARVGNANHNTVDALTKWIKEVVFPYNKGFQVGLVTVCSVPLRFTF